MPLEQPTKVVGRRTAGFIIDAIIWWVIVAVAFSALAKKNVAITSSTNTHVTVNNQEWVVQGGDYAIWAIISIGALIALAIVLEGITGWTPGKLVLGVRVVGRDGQAPGLGRAAVRLVGWVADGIPWFILWGLAGFVTSLSSKGNRRVGDMMAGTYVVHHEAMGQPVAVDGVAVAPPAPGVVVSTPAVGRDAFGNPVPAGHEGGVPVRPATAITPSPAATPAPSPAPASTPPSAAPTRAMPALPKADWYPDPSGTKRLRYWDGTAWTDHVAD